MIGKRTKDEY